MSGRFRKPWTRLAASGSLGVIPSVYLRDRWHAGQREYAPYGASFPWGVGTGEGTRRGVAAVGENPGRKHRHPSCDAPRRQRDARMCLLAFPVMGYLVNLDARAALTSVHGG